MVIRKQAHFCAKLCQLEKNFGIKNQQGQVVNSFGSIENKYSLVTKYDSLSIEVHGDIFVMFYSYFLLVLTEALF